MVTEMHSLQALRYLPSGFLQEVHYRSELAWCEVLPSLAFFLPSFLFSFCDFGTNRRLLFLRNHWPLSNVLYG